MIKTSWPIPARKINVLQLELMVVRLVEVSKICQSLLSPTSQKLMDFLTFEAKKAFIHLQKAFIKASILKHFDSKYHISIETNVLGYTISGVPSQMTAGHSDQLFSNYVTHKNLNLNFSKSEIG